MNPKFLLSFGITGNCMLSVPSSVLRRQQFLLTSIGGGRCRCRSQLENMAASGPVTTTVTEVDAGILLRRITPALDSIKHKGQAGKIAVIGGCREYTGAPYFAAISALKIGADLSHVFCTKDAAPVIKSYSPELIVHPVLEESYSIKDAERALISSRIVEDVMKWIERFDCLVIGPGLGRDPFLLDCISDIMKRARLANVPMVIDGDGLFLITNNLDLVAGYPLAVLTPNINEYKRLVEKVWNCEVDNGTGSEQLLTLARHIGVTILRKGKADLISDSETVSVVGISGSPRRCGGQGDILSGSVAVFSAWSRQSNQTLAGGANSSSNPMVLGSIAGSFLLRKAASLAFENRKRATLTTDIIECLGKSMESFCPAA